jgi:ABC-type polysaccharide/polyol phosphate export permease
MVQRNLIVLAHNAIVVALVWPFIRWPVGPSALLSLAGLLLLYVFLIGGSIVLSIVCVRYRDVPPLVQVVTQFLFFVTPIIWHPEQLKFGGAVLALNPITYMLIIVRDPILGRPVALETWIIAIVLAVASLTAGSLMYLRFRNRVAYWV